MVYKPSFAQEIISSPLANLQAAIGVFSVVWLVKDAFSILFLNNWIQKRFLKHRTLTIGTTPRFVVPQAFSHWGFQFNETHVGLSFIRHFSLPATLNDGSCIASSKITFALKTREYREACLMFWLRFYIPIGLSQFVRPTLLVLIHYFLKDLTRVLLKASINPLPAPGIIRNYSALMILSVKLAQTMLLNDLLLSFVMELGILNW